MTHPIDIKGIDHIVLRVRDKDRAAAFYTTVLGGVLEWDRPELGLTHVRVGRDLIDLVVLDGELGRRGGAGPGSEGRNLDHVCLRIHPFDEAVIGAHLAAHGVEVLEAGRRYGADGFGPAIYVRDPDGNIVELKGGGPEPTTDRAGSAEG